MAKKIINRLDRNLARRLREARREVGLSTRAVAAKLPRRLAVSHTTIASYENEATVPPVTVLAALAGVYQRPLNWFLEDRETFGVFRYRNLKPRTRLSDQRQFEALAGKWAEAYFKLEKHLKLHQHRPVHLLTAQEDQSPDALAVQVRTKYLDLDDSQPVQNVVSVLERFSAWTLEIKSPFEIDGAATRYGNDFVVVLNPEVTNDRVRMNAAHEVAHILYDSCKQNLGWSDSEVEKKAYTFATSLLLPESQLKEAFEGKSFLRLIQYREKFGLSLYAMIFMAEKADIINTTTARWLYSQMAHRGWRQKEPGYISRDRAIRFEMMLESAIHTKALTWGEAERITGIREKDLQQRILSVMMTDAERLDVPEHEPRLMFPTPTNGDDEPSRRGKGKK